MKKIGYCFCLIAIALIGMAGCDITPPADTPQASYSIDSLPGGTGTYSLNQTKMNTVVTNAKNGTYGYTHSIVVIMNDTKVREEYFRNWNRHKLHPCYSISKSVTSALIGMLYYKGTLPNLDAKMKSFFPEYTSYLNPDARKDQITLRHLLTMSSGFTWDELSTFPNDASNPVYKMQQTSDWAKYTMDQPMANTPGTTWTYNTGNTEIMSGIIQNTIKDTAENYAKTNLFDKIGITKWSWPKDPKGRTDCGGGLQLHPVNMAMLGYLYLKNGVYKGVQVVPQPWVVDSTTKKFPTIMYPGVDYGYQWWMINSSFNDPNYWPGVKPRVYDIYWAEGIAGQMVMVIPHAKMVIGITMYNSDETLHFKLASAIYDCIQ